MTGEVIPPSVARRLACDAGIIPVVLGTEGQVLEMGRTARFFTPAQRKALWLRDKGCTYPGCTMPPQWTDAHHITHWAHGGVTDLSNAALLCERHHTHVHRVGLTATLTTAGVVWRDSQSAVPRSCDDDPAPDQFPAPDQGTGSEPPD